MIYTTVSPKPLFDWFEDNKAHRAKLRQAGYSDGRITNWKRRGIPKGEVGNIAPLMGMTYEEYVMAAQLQERRIRTWRRAAVVALVLVFSVPQQSEAGGILHNAFSAHTSSGIHIVQQLARRAVKIAQAARAVLARALIALNWIAVPDAS